MKLSIIIPVLNEAGNIDKHFGCLRRLRALGHEIIVVDGGSTDGSTALAASHADAVLESPRGRALQMNAGARRAAGDVLLFLHADTVLSERCIEALCAHRTEGDIWGRFDVHLSGRHFLLRVVERLMNWRSRATGIATGDQAIFVGRRLFDHCGGYADIPLMEDIDLCRRLKRIQPPLCLPQQVLTSSRRWEKNGILRTIFHMWRLRLAYWLGADPLRLARRYYP